PLRNRCVLHRLPRGGDDVGEVEVALVLPYLRDLNRAELGVRDAQVLRLAPRDRSVELRVSEQRRTAPELADLGGFTLGVQSPLAHPAVATGNVEGDHH